MKAIRVKRAVRMFVWPVATAIMLILTADQVSAGGLFAGKFRAFPVHGGLGLMASGDLNRDGRLDLVVAASYGSSRGGLSVLLGRGDGTFGEHAEVPTGSLVNPSLALGDLNGDRKLDVAVASLAEDAVAVLLGRGDGTFDPYVRYPTGDGPNTVAIGDVNHDGRPDLATTNSQDTSVSVLLGRGDGTFETRLDVAVEPPCRALAIRDLNHDGNPELVTVRSGGGVSILMGHGDGTFGVGTVYGTGGSGFGMAIGDLDGDGRSDIAVVNSFHSGSLMEGHTASVLLGHGDGTFADAVDYETGTEPYSIAIADFDGDGISDLVTANSSDATISILRGLGDGTFTAHTDYATVGSPGAVVAEDLNDDARPEAMVLEKGLFAAIVAVHRNIGTGTFTNTFDYSAGVAWPNGARSISLALGNLDADDHVDLVTANPVDDTVSIRLGHGNGTFGDAARRGMGRSPVAVAIADLNRDGKPDLVTASQGDDCVVVALGNGDGTFGNNVAYATGRAPVSLTVADFDANGTLDLVTAGWGYVTPPLSILFGTGDGSFTRGSDFGTIGAYPTSLTASDVDGDGRPDLLALNASQIWVLLNHGDGTFETPTSYQTNSSPYSFTADDVTGDGAPDIVVVYLFARTISIFAGRGDGTFEPKVDHASASASGAAIADVDGDAVPDLLTVSYESCSLSVHAGIGDGTFQPDEYFGTGNRPTSLAVADVNEDRRPDVVSANSGAGSVSVLLNITPRQARVDIDPDVINVKSRGAWVTAYIEVGDADPSRVDVATVRLAGSIPAATTFEVGDHDADGVPDLMVKFSREALVPLLTPGINKLEVTGSLVTGEAFRGMGSVRVIDPLSMGLHLRRTPTHPIR